MKLNIKIYLSDFGNPNFDKNKLFVIGVNPKYSSYQSLTMGFMFPFMDSYKYFYYKNEIRKSNLDSY